MPSWRVIALIAAVVAIATASVFLGRRASPPEEHIFTQELDRIVNPECPDADVEAFLTASERVMASVETMTDSRGAPASGTPPSIVEVLAQTRIDYASMAHPDCATGAFEAGRRGIDSTIACLEASRPPAATTDQRTAGPADRERAVEKAQLAMRYFLASYQDRVRAMAEWRRALRDLRKRARESRAGRQA